MGSSPFSYPTPLRSVELRDTSTPARRRGSAASCIVRPLRLGSSPGDDQGGINVVQYIQTMMRKEPITLLVMCLMIAILIFGLWDILHVVKR